MINEKTNSEVWVQLERTMAIQYGEQYLMNTKREQLM